MALENPPTYNDINTKIAGTLFTLCQNTTTAKFNAIENCFKSGQTIGTHTFETGKGGSIVEKVSETVLTNIAQSTESATKTFLKNKLYNHINPDSNNPKYPNDEPISMPKFIGYYNNVCEFLVRNVGYITSQHCNNVYLIFEENGFVDEEKKVYPNMSDDTIYAESVALFNSSGSPTDGILNVLKERINLGNNCRYVKYTFVYND